MEPWPEIDEAARRRFESAWSHGAPIPIEQALEGVDPTHRLATLEELVCIELELSWRARPPGPSVDDYLSRFPELEHEDIAARLRADEARAAVRFGDGLRREVEVGRGGMGQVWRAADLSLGRDVALKELSPSARQHPELRRRFLAEARVTAQLEHPGVVPIYRLVEGSDAPYYTMKLVQGRTLSEAAEQATTPLERRRLLEALLHVVRTVAFAHARGVVHRDLKPENILLGAYGETVVLDWGLARARPTAGVEAPEDPALTQPGTVLGTPPYMSPQQVDGDPADARSDQYALGAVLYELLTGGRPYTGRSAEAIFEAVRAGPPVAPRAVDPEVPPELDAICGRAMARQPEDRYPSADALAEDLERYLAGEPTLAWPEPWTRRLQRWARLHRVAVGIGLTALVVAGVASAVGVVAQQRADAREVRRVAALRQSVAAAEDQARADLQAGRYGEARDRLSAALWVVPDEPDLHGQAPALRDRAAALAAFVEDAEAADRLAFLGFDGAAAERAERALVHLGVFRHADWWFELPEGLPPERIDELQWSIWHQLNLLASLVAADDCTAAAAIARHAAQFRPSPVVDRARTCAPRDPCLADGSESYWSRLEQARCTGEAPAEVREGLGHALRAAARMASEGEPREAFGDLQAAMDQERGIAEVHWLAADALQHAETLGGNEAARAYARAIEFEQQEPRSRSVAAAARLQRRLAEARAFAARSLDPADRDWLEPDTAALKERLREAEAWTLPPHQPVAAPARPPVDEPPRRLPVLNGGFELGLARHWGRGMYESERPIWWNSLTTRSTAEIAMDRVHSGERALHIVHETPPDNHQYGTTTQAIPIEEGARYRLTVWAWQTVATPQPAVAIVLDAAWDQHTVAIAQTEGWHRYEREFVAASDTLHLRILTLSPVELWVDDFTVERVD